MPDSIPPLANPLNAVARTLTRVDYDVKCRQFIERLRAALDEQPTRQAQVALIDLNIRRFEIWMDPATDPSKVPETFDAGLGSLVLGDMHLLRAEYARGEQGAAA